MSDKEFTRFMVEYWRGRISDKSSHNLTHHLAIADRWLFWLEIEKMLKNEYSFLNKVN